MRKFTCYIKPGKGETVHANLPLPSEDFAMISGTVLSPQGSPEENALVILHSEEGQVIAETVTDETGSYLFGPLSPDALYTIEVHKNSRTVRMVELQSVDR